jgi:glycosyltransferase involved in cell wall biosynthesis
MNQKNAKIEIWLLIGNLSLGGAERTLVDIANNLDPSQYEVTVWTLIDEGKLVEELSEDITYRTVGAHTKWDLLAVLRFLLITAFEKPDIIQSFLFHDNIIARVASGLVPGVNSITGVREVPDTRSRLRTTIDRITIPLSNKIVSNSKAGERFIRDLGARSDQVSVVPNGRDIDLYNSGVATPDLYCELGLNSRHPVVGTVGRLVERKGHFDLLNAWPIVLNAAPDAQLLVVGQGEKREELVELATDLDCADSVIFCGTRDDIPNVLAAMDVFVFPSHYEGLPGALIEAMIAGLPIVATPVDGNSELIIDGETGLFVPQQDPEELASEIVRLLDAPDRREELSRQAQEYASENYTIPRMVDRFESVYRDTLPVS